MYIYVDGTSAGHGANSAFSTVVLASPLERSHTEHAVYHGAAVSNSKRAAATKVGQCGVCAGV
jgi:hypothetical protein